MALQRKNSPAISSLSGDKICRITCILQMLNSRNDTLNMHNGKDGAPTTLLENDIWGGERKKDITFVILKLLIDRLTYPWLGTLA